MKAKLNSTTSLVTCFFIVIGSFVQTYAQQPGVHFDTDFDQNYQLYGGLNNACDKGREYYKKANERTAKYEQDVEEYKKGLFCNKCKRSKRQIEEADKIPFLQHLENVNGEVYSATAEMYAELYTKYRNAFDPLKKEYDNAMKDCAGFKIKVTDEVNTTVKKYTGYYNTATQKLSTVKDPTKRNKLQAQLSKNHNLLTQYQTQAQQESNKGDINSMQKTINSINDLYEDLRTIDLDIDLANKPTLEDKIDPNKKDIRSNTPDMGRRAGNANSTVESVALTNENLKKQQQLYNIIDQIGPLFQNYMQLKQQQYDAKQRQQDVARAERDKENQLKMKKIDEQRKEERKREYEEYDSKLNEHQLQQKLAVEIGFGVGVFSKPSDADIDYPNLKSIYYIAYFRSEDTVWLMKPIKIDKYSDDSWIDPESLNQKIRALFPDTYNIIAKEYELRTPGYFINEQAAMSSYNLMQQNSIKAGCTIYVINP